jgi:CheY-like chemotaxis protein
MMMNAAKAIGVVKMFDEPMSFALPVFALADVLDCVMQEIDENGYIAGFAQVDISHMQVFPIASCVKRQIGDAAIYAFEAEPECFHVDEKRALTPIVQRALGWPQLKTRPFTRSDMAVFCGDVTTVENAAIQAAENLPDGRTKQYVLVNILVRDKIKNVFAKHFKGEYVMPAFRIDENLQGLSVVLETDASSDDLKRMRIAVGACCNDLACLLHRNEQNWRCNVVAADEASGLLRATSSEASHDSSGAKGQGVKFRVLLVEADAATAASIAMTLATENFICVTTDLRKDGLEIGQISDYDIILLDLMLPDMDGYEVLRR